jgi:ribose/xylose/arabinose/galactoside ABC-type transport system permease subunit
MSRLRGWIPLLLLTTLIVTLGAYTASRQDAFLTDYNLRNLLLTTMPLALVAIGQTNALLVGGFDVSVAALITFCVVTASYTLQPDDSALALLVGALALVGIGLGVGVGNATLIRVLRLPSIIATLATLSILQGASLLLREAPEGPINADVIEALTTSVGFVPVAFIALVFLAMAADLWLYRTRSGLAMRAVGIDAISARRLGMATFRTVFLAFVVCSLAASLAAFYSSAQVQIGSPILGSYALDSIAAAVLGGASLAGGRGSFVGALLAALFLTLIANVLPLFQQPTEYAQMTIGVLILLALVLYQAPELLALLRTGWRGVGRLQARKGEEAPAG